MTLSKRELLVGGAALALAGPVAAQTPATFRSPVLVPWTGPYGGVPPFNRFAANDLPAAFEEGLALRRAEIAAIAADPRPATFDTVFVPLENAGRAFGRAEALFYGVMTQNLSTPEVQAVEAEWSPRIAAADDEITFNPQLFARIAEVHAARERLNLRPEQRRVVELTHDRYVQQGARLDAAGKARLGEINQALAREFSAFSAKLLADENTWTELDSEADLAGLAETQRDSLASAATERGQAGKWAVVNTRSSVDPFLTFSERRDLRERVWRRFKSRGDNGDANDTNAIITRIVRLRADRARLLGYPTHAHWRMQGTVAGTPERADQLMMRMWPAAIARVREEVADMQAIARRDDPALTIEPWDYLFYAEKVRKERFDIDQNQVRPYFELNRLIEAAFWVAGRLYGIEAAEITGQVPVFHPDIRVWRITDRATGAHRGLFYGDNFARAGKRSGAWCQSYREHEDFVGEVKTITSNNNNFVKAAEGQPTLLSLDDGRTLFHEFGHALDGLLSEVRYPSLSETPNDYVEFPSQVNEHWLLTREVLDRFALHHQTRQPMPADMVAKIEASATFNQGYETTAYLASALVDMRMHSTPDGVVDPDAFERQTLTELGMPRELAMRHRTPQFNHLFASDDYSAGYYSYLWAETMDADAWRAFIEAGDPFHRPTAERLRRYILAPGNSSDRAEGYRQFRGRDPDISALMIQRGFAPDPGVRRG